MKRFLLVTVVLLSTAMFALPGWVGLIAERGHQRAVAHFVSLGHPLSASFTRGWFGSQSQHTYRIDDPRLRQVAGTITGDYDHAPSLVVDSRLHHGPLPLRTLRPAWTEARSTLSLRDSSGSDIELPGQLTARLEPDVRSRFRYRAEDGHQSLRQNLDARWQDIDVAVVLGRNGDRVEVDGAVERLELSDGDAQLAIAGFSVDGVQQRVGSGLWTGTTEWRLGSASAADTRAEQIRLDTNVSMVDGQPVYRITGTIADLQSEIVNGQDLRIDLEVSNVDSESAAELLELVASGRAGEIFSPQQRGLLHRVLAGGPQLTLHDLRVPAGEADLEGTGQISVAAGADPSSIGRLAGAIDARTDLAVPRAVVQAIAAAGTQQTRSAIELMIGLGILKPEGNRYRVKASFENGSLNVNGFPVPLPL